MSTSKSYRNYLYAGVAACALVAGSSQAFAQDVTQTSTNNVGISNPPGGNASIGTANEITIGNTSGVSVGIGASVSVGATGAVAATSVLGVGNASSFANYPTGGLGNITQTSVNGNTTGSPILNSGYIKVIGAGNASDGGSLGISAAGAVASFSVLGVSGNFSAVNVNGNITQNSVTNGTGTLDGNANAVTNYGTISAGNLTLSGNGTSVSVSAVGAEAAVSFGGVDATGFAGGDLAEGETISQMPTNYGTVNNTGNVTTSAVNGDGAGVSVGASGAVASVGLSFIGSTGIAALNLGVISQNPDNNWNVTNTATTLTTGDLGGNGSAVSASASGAVASVGASFVDSAGTAPTLGAITQLATDESGADVANTFTPSGAGIIVGNISGSGASVRGSASGASAVVSLTSIGSDMTGNYMLGGGNQTAINYGNATVTNSGSITANDISGVSASAVINATGAGASFSVASINDTMTPGVTLSGPIVQIATNKAGATVSNTGSISVTNGVSGTGASAAISAVGASSVVSFATIATK